jgi:hypothetical protein
MTFEKKKNLMSTISHFSIVLSPCPCLTRKVTFKWLIYFMLFFCFLQPFSDYKTNPFWSAHWNTYSILWNEVLPNSKIENKAIKIFELICCNFCPFIDLIGEKGKCERSFYLVLCLASMALLLLVLGVTCLKMRYLHWVTTHFP